MHVRPAMIHWTGSYDNYFWFEAKDLQFWKVVEAMPELVINNYVAINAFDGAPMKWTDEQLSKGFGYKNGIAVTPRLKNLRYLEYIPSEFNDEWFLRSTPFDNTPVEVFVNYGVFALRQRNAEAEKGAMDKTWDFKLIESEIDNLAYLQEKFWTQMKRVDADKFMGQRENHFLFVTNDKNEIAALVKHVR